MGRKKYEKNQAMAHLSDSEIECYVREANARKYLKKRKEILAKNKEWRDSRSDEDKKKMRDQQKSYRESPQGRAVRRAYYLNNIEKYRAQSRRWREKKKMEAMNAKAASEKA